MLCDDLEGWDGGSGRESEDGDDIYINKQLAHFVVQQKLMQHCKEIILQLKKKTQ